MIDLETVKKNSMTYWYPKIKDLVPTPRTFMVPINGYDWMDVADGVLPGNKDSVVGEIKERACELGYPVFIRTDYLSAKHEWDRTCFVQNEDEIYQHLVRLIDESNCADQAVNAFFVREFLPLEYEFKAFRGMPIAKEFRLFCKDHRLMCVHPYWPSEALRFNPQMGTTRPDDLDLLLGRLYHIHIWDFMKIVDMALKATSWSEDAWSVDVCKTTVGEWYVTDMALAGMSYHWAGCPNIRELSFDGYNEPRDLKVTNEISELNKLWEEK